MKTLTKIGVAIQLAAALSGCATPRTKHTDPAMRIFVDPDSLDKKNLPRLKAALQASGNWIVVDRDAGYDAMNKEQDRQYKDSENRIDQKERYAIWGKQYGVGGVITATSQCSASYRFWANQTDFDCVQNIQVMDAKTGEVLATAEGLGTDGSFFYAEMNIAPSWTETVEKLNESYPKYFEKIKKSETILAREHEAELATEKIQSEKDASKETSREAYRRQQEAYLARVRTGDMTKEEVRTLLNAKASGHQLTPEEIEGLEIVLQRAQMKTILKEATGE
ncbi:MAG: hypothetical protein AB7H97_04370 [Pseudobdellovibrionaceae bacterium]